LSYLANTPTNKQTNKQTNKNRQKHYLLGGGKNIVIKYLFAISVRANC